MRSPSRLDDQLTPEAWLTPELTLPDLDLDFVAPTE